METQYNTCSLKDNPIRVSEKKTTSEVSEVDLRLAVEVLSVRRQLVTSAGTVCRNLRAALCVTFPLDVTCWSCTVRLTELCPSIILFHL